MHCAHSAFRCAMYPREASRHTAAGTSPAFCGVSHHRASIQRLQQDSRERRASVRHSCSSLWMSQGTQAQQIVFGLLGSTLQLDLVFTMSTHFATRDTAVEITIPFPSPEELYREVRDHVGM